MQRAAGNKIRREVWRFLSPLALASALSLAPASDADAADGTWERAWGKNVNGGGVFGICTVASSCQAGTSGGLGGEMNSPEDVAVDGAGNVYLADQNRIQKFDSSGNFLLTWGKNVNGGGGFGVCTTASSCLTGSTGGLGGEMNFPTGVATDGSGNVYVADFLNHRIQKFDSSGVWQRAWGKNVDSVAAGTGFEVCTVAANCQAGTAGALGGEMNAPVKVATDTSGNVYVTDAVNQRIQKFSSSGVWERAWGKDVDSAAGTGFEVCTNPANCQQGTTGTLGGELSGPSELATDAGGFVYVADLSNNRIQKFAGSTGAWQRAWGRDVDLANPGTDFEICTSAANCKVGSTGGEGGAMNSPSGIATDASGFVYVSESTGNRIQKFDATGAWQRAWGRNVNGGDVFGICTVASSCLAANPGFLGGEMSQPRGLAAGGTNLYVAEFSNRRISKFTDAPPPPSTTPLTPPPTSTFTITGQRARAIKRCKKKFPKGSLKRKKCIRKARRLPL